MVVIIVVLITITISYYVQQKTKSELFNAHYKNSLNLVNTVMLNVESGYQSILFHKSSVLKERKRELKNLNITALSILKNNYNEFQNGLISEAEAQRLTIEEIQELRYDNGIGYFWLNDNGRPIPRMVMHPIIPELNGEILDDPRFNCALGREENLFKAFVDVCAENGEGYVDYLWPKPSADGLTADQPKISHVILFKPWNWIIGTGVYIDDIETEAQRRIAAVIDELSKSLAKIRVAQSGYIYIFDSHKYFLIHPSLQGVFGGELVNPETGEPLLDELMAASTTPGKIYDYYWDKPGYEGQYTYKKRAIIHYFEPLDWYICSSVYFEEIARPASEMSRRIILISSIILIVAVLITVFLSKTVSGPLTRLAQSVSKIDHSGIDDSRIPVSGSTETKKLGIVLREMLASIRMSEKALRESEERYRIITENAPDAMYVIDSEGIILDWNTTAEKLLGYEKDELIGKSIIEQGIVAPEMKDTMLRQFSDMISESTGPQEYTLFSKSGEKLHVEIKSDPIKIQNRKLILGLARDITERKIAEETRHHLEEQLRHAQKLESISKLTGGIAHDFNNILGAIIGSIDLMLMKIDSDNPCYEHAQTILDKSLRASELVKQMLAYSRQQKLNLEAININDSVRGLTDFLGRAIPENINLAIKTIDNPLSINSDKTAIDQIIMNLCLNAIDAMKDGGQLTIETENFLIDPSERESHDLEPGRYICLRISDTGHGIEPEKIQKIYEPFFTTKEIGKGSGLGLSMVYGLVKQHGGIINCTSEVEVGTTFEIMLPAIEGVKSKANTVTNDLAISKGGANILLVEDEADLLDILDKMLNNLGYQVLTASNGLEALDILVKNEEIDLIISDIIMPNLGGFELYEKMQKINPDIPFIFTSGYASNGHFQKYSIKPGMVIIRKPFRLAEVGAALEKILNLGSKSEG